MDSYCGLTSVKERLERITFENEWSDKASMLTSNAVAQEDRQRLVVCGDHASFRALLLILVAQQGWRTEDARALECGVGFRRTFYLEVSKTMDIQNFKKRTRE